MKTSTEAGCCKVPAGVGNILKFLLLDMHPLAAESRSRLFKTSYYAFCFESVASQNVNERYCIE